MRISIILLILISSFGCGRAGNEKRPLSASAGSVAAPAHTLKNLAETVAPNCADSHALCVGAGQKYATIQSAVDATHAGDTVWVFDGTYAGARVSRSGTATAPITIKAVNSQAKISSGGPTGDGIRFENVSYITVEGLVIHNPSRRCVAARGATPDAPMRGLIVRGITCSGSALEGFYLSEVSNSLIESNVISASGRSGGSRAHGLYLANAGSKGTTIRGNRIFNNLNSESNGIHVNGDISVGGNGISSGLVMENNVIYANGQNGLNLDGVQDSVFRNNLVYANAKHAFRAYQIDGGKGPKRLRLVNNTFLTSATGGWAVKITEDLGDHIAFNNIFLSDNSRMGSICLDHSPRFQSSHNAVVDRFSNDNESSLLGLTQWQSLGYDASSVVSSPSALFVSAAQLDFRPKTGASSIDQGIAMFAALSAPGMDVQGFARPQGLGFDIGAYEFGDALAAPTPTLSPTPAQSSPATFTPGPKPGSSNAPSP